MTAQLFSSRTSPYARRIRVLLRELQLHDRFEEVFTDPFATPTELIEKNPLSKIPVLTTEDGLVLPDSGLIAEYLLAEAGLSTPALAQEWEHAADLIIASGIMDAAVNVLLESRRPESIRFPAYIDRQTAAISRSLVVLEPRLPPLPSEDDVAGMLPITLGVALAYVDFRLPWHDWRKTHPAIADWVDNFSQRPSMQETRPPDPQK